MRQDIRFALRQMGNKPGFAAVAVVLLALGIGGSTAVFCVLYQVLLRPLPYPNAQQLFLVHNYFPKSQVSTAGVSGYDYAELAKHKEVFACSGIYYYNDLTLTGAGAAQHIDAVNASASLFDVFAVKPQLGRVFSAAEDQAGADGTALLSDSLWRGAFGADPDILNRVIRLNDKPFRVIGVMPPSFQFPSRETQLWIPTALKAGEFTLEGGRLEKWLHMVSRLAPSVTSESANSALAVISDNIASHLAAFYPRKEGWHFGVRPLADEQTQSIRRWLYLAFGAVFCVLLIAAINVSSLLLIRGNARQGEISIRLAMGASRLRLAGQMLTETAILALLGCVLGSVFALGAIHAVNLYGPLSQPTPLWSRALLFAPAVAFLSTLLAGLLPALLATKSGASRTFTRTGSGWREIIMIAQIAIAVTLIFTALQMNRSFLNLTRVPPGFQTQHIWTGALDLPRHHDNFFEELQQNLAALPGVQSASAGVIPFNPSGIWTEALNLPGRPKPATPPEAQINLPLPGYFETIGIPLLQGRTFTPADRAGAPRVAVIDEELAHRYFGGDNPIGQLIGSGGGSHPATIIGVVGSVHNSDLGGPGEPEVYYPALQERTDSMYLVLRTKGDIDPASAVRQAIAKLDPAVALYDVQFMQDRVAKSLKLRRFIAGLLNGLAGTGFLLAIVGLYGSLAHLVELRQREIGIRVALGATRARIVQIILTRGAIVVAAGLIIGAFAANFAAQAIRSQLFGVGLTDVEIWLSVLGAMLIAGAVSAYLPAWRAARIDPSVTLRHE